MCHLLWSCPSLKQTIVDQSRRVRSFFCKTKLPEYCVFVAAILSKIQQLSNHEV
ncbi:hypothetical protein F511_31058 [Dorcoceras hygrometricum]|uniref:Uncharacterized protein n=1 Tax=Dorcoceras hygrometricum TaxID=472368 RepID=A0A2Z7CJW1_9LAMI|nr:hypothetical protein F511_31058 [Dorcoceras hygrometricum]